MTEVVQMGETVGGCGYVGGKDLCEDVKVVRREVNLGFDPVWVKENLCVVLGERVDSLSRPRADTLRARRHLRTHAPPKKIAHALLRTLCAHSSFLDAATCLFPFTLMCARGALARAQNKVQRGRRGACRSFRRPTRSSA